LKGSVKELNMFHNYEIEKTVVKPRCSRKPAIMLSCLVLPPEIVMHDDTFNVISERLPIYVSCITILGGRTEQHVTIGFGELAAVD